MNLDKIKQKYKQILEEPQLQSARSEQQWELAYSRMKNKRRKHILTQSQCMNRSCFSMTHTNTTNTEQPILKIKQKLAQSIANHTKKDLIIEQLKQQNIKSKEQIKLLEQQIIELKQTLNTNEQKIIEQKVAYSCIQKNIQTIQKQVHSQKIDKQLLQRQIQFYQTQLQNNKLQIQQKNNKIIQIKKQFKSIQKYKNIIHKLKQDIIRLRQLLSQTDKYKILSDKIQNKHYYKKSYKQQQYWISQDLLTDVQNFLKKQSISLNPNKQFLQNLIKFISKHEQHIKLNLQKKYKKLYNSKQKDYQRKINHSLNFMEIRQQQMKKSQIGSSLFKSRRNTLNDSKRTDSYIYDKLQKSLLNHSFNKNRQICIQILGSFRKGVLQLTQCKQINKKKLIKLVDWVIDGIISLFPKQRILSGLSGERRIDNGHANRDFRLESQQIKIEL